MNTIVLALLVSQAPGAEIDAQIAALQASTAAQSALITELVDRINALETSSTAPGGGAIAFRGAINVRDYMAPGMDLADAIWIIQHLEECSGPQRGQGCEVIIPASNDLPGSRYLTKTATICKQMLIRGVGVGGPRAPTQIETLGVTAFKIAGTAECMDFEPDDGCDTPLEINQQGGACPSGAGTRIANLRIDDVAGYGQSAPVYSACVHSEALFHLDHVYCDGFTQGLRYSCGVADRQEDGVTTYGWPFFRRTNCNVSSVRNSIFANSRHSGIDVRGADANAYLFSMVDVASNCKEGAKYVRQFGFPGAQDVRDGLMKCGNFSAREFLGGTSIAMHSAAAIDLSGEVQLQMVVNEGNGNAAGVHVGVYTELPAANGNSIAGPDVFVVGGSNSFHPDMTQGTVFTDAKFNRLVVVDTSTNTNPQVAGIYLGASAATTSLVEFRATGGNYNSAEALRLEFKERSGGARVFNMATFGFNLGTLDVVLNDGANPNRSGRIRTYQRTLLSPCNGFEGDSAFDGAATINDSEGVSLCAP